MSRLDVLKREAVEIAQVTLYFFFCFCVILTIKKLLLAEYQVKVSTLSTAAISALVIAKIVIVLDKTSVGKHFDAHLTLAVAALCKTLIYLAVTFLILLLEKLFHAHREFGGGLLASLKTVWLHKDWNLMALKLLCIGLMFLIYHLYAGLDRCLGAGQLRRLIFTRPGSNNTYLMQGLNNE